METPELFAVCRVHVPGTGQQHLTGRELPGHRWVCVHGDTCSLAKMGGVGIPRVFLAVVLGPALLSALSAPARCGLEGGRAPLWAVFSALRGCLRESELTHLNLTLPPCRPLQC